ncbi:gypsy/ty3 retroelement polyprotein [Tanacetum coccineum]
MERLRQDLVIQRLESSNAGRDRNLEGGMRGNSQFSRVTKIEFLKFRGENVRGGCLSVSSSLKLITLLRIARNAILKRFDVVYDDPLGEVKKLKQTNQVQEYIDAFDRLLCRINLDEDHCISFFLAGLNSEIELAVRMFKPRTLAEVYGLCNGPKPIALPAPNATWRTKLVTSTPAASFRKQLTQKEVEEKRAKNQFLGDTMPKLVDTELEEEVLNSEEIIEYSPHISLNVINECEMVLGIKWLSTLGNILSNFKELRIEFKHNGRKVVLRGTQKANLQWMQGSKTLIKTPGIELSSMVLCVYPTTTLHMIEAEESKVVPPGISRMLGQYLDVFAIPTSLPPIRPCDHKIPLKEGTVPITSRPYRYPPTQKDAVEVMVKELLDTRYFTNIDLKSGYHQIRMNLADVEKTAFKTHEGHYEFLVMPFGLTNAPSTFQALINLVFKEYLRKFVLVFFDDILVYNPTMEAHVQHLETILQDLRQNTIYAKQSKCVFGTKRIEYLGHVITKDGVATNGYKIEAMQNWPRPINVK